MEKRTEELKIILDLLRRYRILPVRQICRLMEPIPPEKTKKMLYRLFAGGRLYYGEDRQYVGLEREFQITAQIRKQIQALDIALLFQKKLIYHTPLAYPSTLYFLIEGHPCEVIAVPSGEEKVLSHLLAKLGGQDESRFLLIEDPEQIPLLNIPNVVWYCQVDEDGNVKKYIEKED